MAPKKAQIGSYYLWHLLLRMSLTRSVVQGCDLVLSAQCPLRILTHSDFDLASVVLKLSTYGKIKLADNKP